MKSLLSCIALFVVFLLPSLAFAAQFHAGSEYTLPKGQILQENLYASGGTITIDGDVQGDVVVAGGQIVINGNVRDDVMAAGGNVTINGQVNGDVRVAGGQITINNTVQHDMLASGGLITVTSGAQLLGDTLISGGQLMINGTVNHPLKLAGGSATINGTVTGDVSAKVGELTIGDNANIQGKLAYDSPSEAAISSQAHITGPVTYHQVQTKSWLVGVFSLFWFARLLMTLTLGLIVFYLFGRQSQTLVRYSLDNPTRNGIQGFLVLILTPIACVILFITIIGIPLGFMGLFAYITMLIGAYVFSGMILGSLVFKLAAQTQHKEYPVTWQTVALGIALMSILALVPFIGGLIRGILVLITLGAISQLTYKRIERMR